MSIDPRDLEPEARDALVRRELDDAAEDEAVEAPARNEPLPAPASAAEAIQRRRQTALPKLADPAAPLLEVTDLKTHF
jgi:hypothetical protein